MRARQGQRAVRRRRRRDAAGAIVDAGVVQGYFLSTYSARKLGMRTTGHAGGSHNLTLTSRRTAPGDDLDAMLRKLGRGLFVIELMGQGVNYVTGDYSRGAAGFWVENGEIALPGARGHDRRQPARHVRRRSTRSGADAYTMGSKTIGSVLIDKHEDRRRLTLPVAAWSRRAGKSRGSRRSSVPRMRRVPNPVP